MSVLFFALSLRAEHHSTDAPVLQPGLILQILVLGLQACVTMPGFMWCKDQAYSLLHAK